MNGEQGAGSESTWIRFENEGHYSGLELASLRSWLSTLLHELAPQADSFGICWSSDRRIRGLNRDYRELDRATDVLSFEGDESPEGNHLGDLVISIPTARRQARSLGHSLQRELRELILHGVLHCLGMDHEKDGGEMNRFELKMRQRWIVEEDS